MNFTAVRQPLLVLGARPYTLAVADSFAGHPDFEILEFVENLERAEAGTSLSTSSIESPVPGMGGSIMRVPS